MPHHRLAARALSALMAAALAVYPAIPVRAKTCEMATPAAAACGCATGQMHGSCCGCCTRPVPAPERSSPNDLARDAAARVNLALDAPTFLFGLSAQRPRLELHRAVAVTPAEGASLFAQGILLLI